MVSDTGGVDSECLRRLYQGGEEARAVLDHFASRERNWVTTTVDRIHANILNEGKELSRGDVIRVFQELERCGCGSFIVGRKGKLSRFEWQVQMVSVGQAAAGEIVPVEKVTPEEEGQEGTGSFVKHTYRLRPDVSVALELPIDFTTQEASRMARFIETLPFQGSTGK